MKQNIFKKNIICSCILTILFMANTSKTIVYAQSNLINSIDASEIYQTNTIINKDTFSISTKEPSIKEKQLFIENYINSFIKYLPYEPITYDYISPDMIIPKEKKISLQLFMDYIIKDTSISTEQRKYLQLYIDYLSTNFSLTQKFNTSLFENYFKLYKNNESLTNWGFKDNIVDWVVNDRNYDWYVDQGDTGRYSRDNCGPSVATMAVKWHDQTFNKTAEDARNKYLSSGGWWDTSTVVKYLYDNNVYANYIHFNKEQDQLKNIIKSGNIVILCINTYGLSVNNSNERIGRFYTPSKGHFIILKGYIETDNGLFFESYDPNSLGLTNDDNTLKGKNRYYSFEDIKDAIKPEWSYMIMVPSSNLI